MATSSFQKAAKRLEVADKIRRNNPYKDWREYATVDDVNRKMLHERLATDLLFRVREGKKDVKKFKAHSFMFYSRSQAFGRLFERMMDMRNKGETDVIEADEKVIAATKNGKVQPEVHTGLQYKYQDENDPNIRGCAFDIKTGIVDIYDVRPDVFEEIMRYLYYEEVVITKGNIYEMIYAAHKFRLYSLTEKCNKFLRGIIQITEQNAIKYLETSLTYNALDLMQMCVSFLKNRQDVLKNADLEDPPNGRRSLQTVCVQLAD